jgi:hypothetical protein
MAVLTTSNVVQVYTDGVSDRVVLFALRKVTTGDTYDLSPFFSVPKQAIMLGTTVNGSATSSVAGTVVTMPAGLANDAAMLLVWGVSA